MLSFFSDPFPQDTHAGTNADVQIGLILKDDADGDESFSQGIPTEWITLDNYGNDRVTGQTDVHKGQILRKANQKIRDYAEFYPDTAEIQIVLDLNDNWFYDDWGTDLLKLYFAGKNGKNVVIRCYAGVQWITHGKENRKTFNCTKLEDSNPARSIEMFKAHTCDWLYSGSSSKMKLKFCKKREQFRSFNKSTKNLDCCSTNKFKLGSTRNEYKRYDAISRKDVLDGGEVLGDCEGFDLLGTKIYVRK